VPSIEIVCVGQKAPLSVPGLPFAVESETHLRSHRSPNPIWQADFDRLAGCIYHLGNPDLRENAHGRAFFAYDLLSDRSREGDLGLLEFASPLKAAMSSLLDALLSASPQRQVVLTSDWQFGPSQRTRGDFGDLAEFWKAHDRGELRLNGLYVIRKAS
jgi:hypothetical protein